MIRREDIIDLELRSDGSYARPHPKPDLDITRPDMLMRRAYWVSGFLAGLLAGLILFGEPAKAEPLPLPAPLMTGRESE